MIDQDYCYDIPQPMLTLLRSHAAALERIAELEAENARLRHHAEAMAGEIADFCGDHPTHAAYRAEFKEEGS